MKLVVGLGNIGPSYTYTRHNVGFLCLDDLVKKENANYKLDTNLECWIAKSRFADEVVLWVKPTTLMNLSGRCIRKVMDYYQIDQSDLLVIADDVSLAFQQLRLRYDSSAGGHNGINNIITYLGSQVFLRLKVGVGANNRAILSDYVLSPFSKQELIDLETTKITVQLIVQDFLRGKPYLALAQQYNGNR
jgi:PTH1 family peptidyl-tRNA hydrolase